MAVLADSSTGFWIPPPGTRKGPQPAFPQVRGPFSTWWQVKDSNLRSFRDGFTDQRRQACDQRQYLSPDNFRAYSPQIAGDNRQQPDTPASNSRSRRRTTSSPTPQTQAIMLRSRFSPTRPAPRSTLRLLRHHRRVCRDDPRSVRCDADPPRGAASCGRRLCRKLLGQDRSARWAQRQPVIRSADVDQGFFSRSESRRRVRRAVTRNCVSRTTPTIATTAAPATAAMNNAVPSGRDPVKPR